MSQLPQALFCMMGVRRWHVCDEERGRAAGNPLPQPSASHGRAPALGRLWSPELVAPAKAWEPERREGRGGRFGGFVAGGGGAV